MLRKFAFGFAMVAVMISSGGCLLRASDSAEPTAIPQLLPSPTPFPTATWTDAPTQAPEVFVVTATPDANALAQMTAVAQVSEPTIDPIILGVTQTIAAATQVVVNMTASAEFVFDIPTATFTLDPTFNFIPTASPTTGFVGGTGDCEHVVSAGENLFRIGLRYGVGYQTIANYNGIANPALITIGQRIIIPNCGVGSGTTESSSTGSTGSTGTIDTSTGSTCGSEVVVDQGDTLFAISLRCNVLIRTIMSLNGISNPDLIYFNQTLRLQ